MKYRIQAVVGMALWSVVGVPLSSWAAEQGLKPYVDAVQTGMQGMTLWELIKNGGGCMIVLALLSVLAGAYVIYGFLTMKEDLIVPREFTEKLISLLRERKYPAATQLCKGGNSAISQIALAGLERKNADSSLTREAMEAKSKEVAQGLWQGLSVLADVASIAPMVGLLGTVLGMIQAFNVIAFETAVVKPIMLAGGIAKAMITTAGGLIVAIPTMLFYTYFRGRVSSLLSIAQMYTYDIIGLVGEQHEPARRTRDHGKE